MLTYRELAEAFYMRDYADLEDEEVLLRWAGYFGEEQEAYEQEEALEEEGMCGQGKALDGGGGAGAPSEPRQEGQ